jgi:hypothetical protein
MAFSSKWRRAMAIGLVMALLGGALPGEVRLAAAQTGPRVQEFTGTVDDGAEIVFYDLYGLHAGETIYAYAEAAASALDTYLAVGDIDFNDVLAEDDDSGGGTNSALEYIIPADGDYSLAVTRYDETSSGAYRLLIGIDEPEVLGGEAQPTGDEVAVYYGTVPAEGYDLGGLEVTDCSTLEQRPSLSGPEERLETGFFVVHYTTAGRDGATPYYAQEVANVIDRIWKYQVSEFGWPAPPTDCGEGGDTRYDVYLLDTLSSDGTMGYSMPEALLGDNPNTPPSEAWATYSYLAIDNDFDGDPTSVSLMRTTAAHEFNHSIQFGYDLNDIGGEWYYEATATWMETQTFPEDEDASPYVIDLFQYPDLCIGATPDDPKYSTRIYAEWLLIDSLVRDYGPQVVRRLWELIAVEEGMDSFYRLAEELGTTPQAIVQRFAIRNLLLDYTLADRFNARVRVEGNVNGVGEVRPRHSGVQELGVDYVLITRPGVYTFSLDQPDLMLTLVGVDQPNRSAAIFDLGQSGTVDTRPYTYAYLIVLNTRTFDDAEHCSYTDWVLAVRDGSDAPLTNPEPKLWSAAHFIPAG